MGIDSKERCIPCGSPEIGKEETSNLGSLQGEILGLRWKDIDFDSNSLRVVQTLRHNSTELVATTKTKASTRNISLSLQTIAALRKQRSRVVQEKLQAG